MEALKTPVDFETAFSTYNATHIIGQGGAGRVFSASDVDGTQVAIKVLDVAHASSDKRRRFKNETAFLARQRHEHLVSVLDHGLIDTKVIRGPFYVMPRFDGSLRDLLKKGIPPESVLALFSQILHGIEAAHLLGAVHRDLKPENVLTKGTPATLAIADFGVARFSAEQLVTQVETAHGMRLANFEYAAPEQRRKGEEIGVPADVFALGLILNELFTNQVPHGSGYKRVQDASPEFAFVDPIIEEMIRQDPAARPRSVEDIKRRLRLGREELMAAQRLGAIQAQVVKVGEIDHPLVLDPPKLVDADWNADRLRLVFDKPLLRDWVDALQNMGNFSYSSSAHPRMFKFQGNEASIRVEGNKAQSVIDHFKGWIPIVTAELKQKLENEERRRVLEEKSRLKQEAAALEARQKVMQGLRF